MPNAQSNAQHEQHNVQQQQQQICAADVQDCRQEAEMNRNSNIIGNKKVAILYSRLSRDDELDGTSGSITNQEDMLRDYAEKNGFTPFLHLSDDGYSGTDFKRPNWVKLIAMVEAGEVSAIIAKDTTRLYRDYLRAGMYREMFREKKVRLITVVDCTDSAKGEDDFTPFREIISEWYARDTSKKIRAVFQSRMSNGKRCSGAIPYGYLRKDGRDGNVNELVIDEEAAVIVRRIFQMIIEGMGVNAIATTLMNEEVPIPSEHWKRIGVESRSHRYPSPYGWTPTTIGTIVANPAYKGMLVLGKTRNSSYKADKKAVETPEDERYVFEGALPIIVDAETWTLAQQLRRTVRRTPSADLAPNPLTGLLYCAQCGAKMSHRRSKNAQGYRENAYACSANRKGIVKCCSLHYISSKAVERLVLDVIRRTTNYVRENEEEFVEKIREMSVQQAEKAVKENRKLLAKSERRRDELNTLVDKLFEDHALNKIPEKHYERLLSQYDAEQSTLDVKIEELKAQIDSYLADETRADKFIELARKYTRFETLDAVTLNEFVERINVHEAVKVDGVRTQEVDIYLKYVGDFDVPDNYDEPMSEEQIAEAERRAKLDKKNAYERERLAKKKRLSERTPEQVAADEAEKYQKRLEYNRAYSRAWAKRKAAEKKTTVETTTASDAGVVAATA